MTDDDFTVYGICQTEDCGYVWIEPWWDRRDQEKLDESLDDPASNGLDVVHKRCPHCGSESPPLTPDIAARQREIRQETQNATRFHISTSIPKQGDLCPRCNNGVLEILAESRLPMTSGFSELRCSACRSLFFSSGHPYFELGKMKWKSTFPSSYTSPSSANMPEVSANMPEYELPNEWPKELPKDEPDE